MGNPADPDGFNGRIETDDDRRVDKKWHEYCKRGKSASASTGCCFSIISIVSLLLLIERIVREIKL